LAIEIFETHGFPIEALGIKRIKSARDRWSSAYKKAGAYGLLEGKNDKQHDLIITIASGSTLFLSCSKLDITVTKTKSI